MKNKYIITIILAIILFSIYTLTLAPDVTFEDSGELILSGYTLSIAHPPGYPLFSIITKLFSFIPLSKVGFRINLASAFFASLSVAIFFLTFAKISYHIFPDSNQLSIKTSLIATTLFAFSTTLWNIATVTEVYALNLFLFAIQLFLISKIIESQNIKYLYSFAWFNSLALTNHHSSIFLTIILLFFVIQKRRILKFKNYFNLIFIFLLGLLIYIYLPLRSNSSLPLNWGDPSNLKNFIAVITRKQYGTLPYKWLPFKELIQQLKTINPLYEINSSYPDIFQIKFLNLVYLVILFALFIIGYASIKNKTIKITLLSIFLLYTLFTILITQTPTDKLFTLKVFFVPAWAIFFFMVTTGIMSLINKFKTPKLLKNILFFLPILILFSNFKFLNKNKFHLTIDYTNNLLKNIKYNSIIFTLKDNETFPLWKIFFIDYKRNDVIIINLVLLSEQWYIEQITSQYKNLKITLPYLKGTYQKDEIRKILVNNIILSNPEKDIYFTTTNFENFLKLDLKLISSGILYKLSADNNCNLLYYINFKNLDYYFDNFSMHFDRLSLEKFIKPKIFIDTQSKIMLQNIANALMNYASCENLYKYKLVSFLNTIIGLELNNFYPFIYTGNIHYSQNNFTAFEYFYRKAITLQPTSKLSKKLSELLNNQKNVINNILLQAEKYYRINEFENAIIYYKKALSLQPNNAQIIASIGDCYFNLKNYEKAMEYYKTAIKLNPSYITPYYNLGGCYLMIGDRENAIATWQKGLYFQPDNQLLINAIKRYGK